MADVVNRPKKEEFSVPTNAHECTLASYRRVSAAACHCGDSFGLSLSNQSRKSEISGQVILRS